MAPAIYQLCLDPASTRAMATAGGPTPCHRCLAFRPGVRRECLFLNQPMTQWQSTKTEDPDQMPLFRTFDKLEGET